MKKIIFSIIILVLCLQVISVASALTLKANKGSVQLIGDSIKAHTNQLSLDFKGNKQSGKGTFKIIATVNNKQITYYGNIIQKLYQENSVNIWIEATVCGTYKVNGKSSNVQTKAIIYYDKYHKQAQFYIYNPEMMVYRIT